MKFLLNVAVVAAIIFVCLTQISDATDFGSFTASCDYTNQTVTFTNYAQSGCQGNVTTFSSALNKCEPEFLLMSWNAYCNSTTVWYNNYVGRSCGGSSTLTRRYCLNKCQNCTTADCKDWTGKRDC